MVASAHIVAGEEDSWTFRLEAMSFPQASDFTSQSPSVFTCEMGIVIQAF